MPASRAPDGMTDYSRYTETRFPFDARRETVWREVGRYLQRHMPIHGSALEIGAAYCHFINNLDVPERHALDISADLPRHAAHGVVAHVGSCTAMPQFGDRTMDVVMASNLFEHLTRAELTAALAEVHRILKPCGRLIVIQPNYRYCSTHYFDDYTHIQVFSHVSLRDRLAAAGFRIVDVRPKFLPFSMTSRLPAAGFLVRLYLRSPFKPLGAQMLVVAERPPAD